MAVWFVKATYKHARNHFAQHGLGKPEMDLADHVLHSYVQFVSDVNFLFFLALLMRLGIRS